jgi:hypothetical protein
MRPNTGMQRTALCAHKIAAILKAGISPTALPIYQCAAAEAQAVRRFTFISNETHPYGSKKEKNN